MSKDRPATLELRIANPRQLARQVTVALGLPPEIESEKEEIIFALPSGVEWSRLPWPCRPRKRGKYVLDRMFVQTASWLGFWAVRKSIAASSEIRVYPNLLGERRSLAPMFLHRGAIGLHAQRQLGKGREFEKLREYVPGDGFDEIHWKATARRGRPITKVFQIERTQEIYVVLDGSRLSARPAPRPAAVAPAVTGGAIETVPETTLERFVTAALTLGLAAEQQGDFFGVVTFTDKLEKFLRARNGKAHYSACRELLYTFQPKSVSPDFEEICTFIRLRLRRRALLIFLTALDDPVLAESFTRNIELIARQHVVLVNMIARPEVAPLFSNPAVFAMDDLYQHLAGHLLWQKLQELEKVLHRRGIKFSLVKNERLSADLVSQYLTVKQRQLL